MPKIVLILHPSRSKFQAMLAAMYIVVFLKAKPLQCGVVLTEVSDLAFSCPPTFSLVLVNAKILSSLRELPIAHPTRCGLSITLMNLTRLMDFMETCHTYKVLELQPLRQSPGSTLPIPGASLMMQHTKISKDLLSILFQRLVLSSFSFSAAPSRLKKLA